MLASQSPGKKFATLEKKYSKNPYRYFRCIYTCNRDGYQTTKTVCVRIKRYDPQSFEVIDPRNIDPSKKTIYEECLRKPYKNLEGRF